MSDEATLQRFYSVPELAELLAVKSDKVLSWINSNELKAFNAATRRTGKPRWRITAEAFEAFQNSRSNVAAKPTAPQRRPRRQAADQPRQWIK